jgi:putative phosphoesterase
VTFLLSLFSVFLCALCGFFSLLAFYRVVAFIREELEKGTGLPTMAKKIGVLSDTHGLLRGEVRSRLCGCDRIIHAGDIGTLSVLTELGQIAEVVAVRGNVDTGSWAKEIKKEEFVDVEGCRICVVHDISTLSLDPAAAGVGVVIYGHSHKPAVEWRGGILYLNPGSAGPQRPHLPISMALLRITAESITPELIEL